MTTSRRDNRQEQELRAIIDDIPGNDKCADCEAVNPRWASYSLGIFLCTRCAGIHRKNSDISKVKSISLDQWTLDQIQKMREVGNTISNYKYNPLREWPLQDDDQTMERFIRDKYERQMFMSQRETANFTPVKSAMKGSAKPIEPGKSSSAVIKYSKELDTLREMGFTDRSKNVDVLKKVMGDVTSATDILVAMEEIGGSSVQKHEKPRVRFTADTIGGEERTPQMQAANPFDMWAQSNNPGPQQNFQNPFSSIPPSMYNNQNFVQNVQAQGQPAAPFMGYQTTGQDAIQQQYAHPAVPLRSQLTGGQLLRPQYPTQAMQEPPAHQQLQPQPQPQPPQQQQQQQPQFQQPTQPLRHQLTGRPAPPPPEPLTNTFAPQQQGAHTQNSYQQSQNVFANRVEPQAFANNIGPSQTQQFLPQSSMPYQESFQSQPQLPQPESYSAAPARMNASQQPGSYQAQTQSRQQTPQPSQKTQPQIPLTPQLTGMRPKFQPTVDLNAPFGNFKQPSASPYQSQSPQLTGQIPPAQNNSPQRTGQPQKSLQQPGSMFAPVQHSYQRQSPQTTGQFASMQAPQTFVSNRFQTSSPQIAGQGQPAAVPQSTGQYTQNSYRPMQNQAAAPSQSSDPFGSSFTAPLRAQLTGIQQSSQSPVPGYLQQQNTAQTNNFTSHLQQSGANQYSAAPTPFGTNTLAQGGNNMYNSQNSNGLQLMQPLFSQNTGNASNGLYPQRTGNQAYQPPSQQQPPMTNFQAPSNVFQSQPFQQQQQQQQQPNQGVRPQQTGFQPQAGYANNGMNPAKPFDKAGIMSLYGAQQPLQAQQYQSPQQYQPQQQQQQQQPLQQQYTNGYSQQPQQNGYQQGYGGYQ